MTDPRSTRGGEGAPLARVGRMTLQEWIDRRKLEPPEALRERLREAVMASPQSPGRPVADSAADAALVLLDELLRGADSSRSGALGLLTVDALMTYAFEAAADDAGRLDALGAEAMRRIAAAAAAPDLPQ